MEIANALTVDGTITASGQSGAGQFMGGGSGGGIYIACRRFNGGAGGGGRIAIWYWQGFNNYLGTIAATGQVHQTYLTTPTRSGSNGTVRLFSMPVPEPGLILQLR